MKYEMLSTGQVIISEGTWLEEYLGKKENHKIEKHILKTGGRKKNDISKELNEDPSPRSIDRERVDLRNRDDDARKAGSREALHSM